MVAKLIPYSHRQCACVMSRLWMFKTDVMLSSSPALKCVKVYQMPEEHSESQILTCAYCSTNRLLAIGLFNGSLHLADLSDVCLSIDDT